MRKLFMGLLLAGLTGLIFSCQKENSLTDQSLLATEFALATDVSAVGTEELPAAIAAYVTKNQHPLEIEAVYHSPSLGYQVVLENGLDIYFNSKGDCLEKGGGHGGGHGDGDHGDGGGHGDGDHGDGDGDGGANRCMLGDSLSSADLPQAALDYVTTNYADATIASVVVKPSGKFGVELSDGTVLLFDVDGTFIEECTGHPGDPGDGHGTGGDNHGGGSCLRGDTLSLDSLPQAVLDYLATNNASDTVAVVTVKPNGWYAVGLTNGSVLLFDADGAFVRTCGDRPGHGGPTHGGTDVAPDQLPQAILDYLAANHADATVSRAVITFSGKYFIRLSDGTKLIFDENGNILFDSGD